MKKESNKLYWVYLRLILVSAMLVLPANVAVALDIHGITFCVTEYRQDGVLSNTPYEFTAGVNGDDITSVTMTPPVGDPIAFNTGMTGQFDWGLEVEEYETLEALRTLYPLGNYVFTFNGGADSVTLNHNPAVPTSFVNITYPVHGSTDISLNPTYTWDSYIGYGDALNMAVDEEGTAGLISLVIFADISETSWTPTETLNPGRLHLLEVSVYAETTAQPYNYQTTSGDSFEYYDLFENCNYVMFVTISLVDIDIVADTITPKTKWITCHIWPPDGYDVTDIKSDSILLNGEIQAVRTSVRRKQQMLVAKFPTAELNLEPSPELLALTVTGELTDETPFIDSDFVTVIQKGGPKN